MFIVGSHCTSERLAMFIAWFQLPFEDLQLKLYEGFNLWPLDLEIRVRVSLSGQKIMSYAVF